MKVIKKYTCYVELSDIEYLGLLPNNIKSEIQDKFFYSPFIKFIRFDKDESIRYFKSREDIIDYNSICNLTDEELSEMINEGNKAGHLLEDLINYRNNRELYDKEIKSLPFRGINKVKLNYLSATTKIEPVEKVPVSPSKIEELDRSIKNKCRSNARERLLSEEMAESYIVSSKIKNDKVFAKVSNC